MTRSLTLLSILCPLFLAANVGLASNGPAVKKGSVSLATDWPWWRGPTHNGVAASDQTPPTRWSDSENVLWKSEVPGRSHGSPIVVGEYVYLTAAEPEEEIQSVICYSRASGKQAWKSVVHRGNFVKKMNRRSTHASTSLACDGERLYVNFLNKGAVYTSALDMAGKVLWQKKISDYIVHQGYGASPVLYKSMVIVSADNKGGGAVCALRRDNGEVVWRHERPKKPNYPSPVIVKVSGREQLILIGCDLVTSLDPNTGKKSWEIEGATTECVTTTVTDGKHIFTSGGYPDNHVSAVVADGSGKVAWRNGVRVYVPSMLYHDGHLYAVSDAGIAHCWEAASGKTAWKSRLGGTFNASPVLVGEHIYATNEKGQTFVYKASPKGLSLLATNQLGREVYATAAICDSRVYMRVAHGKGSERQEYLYCIGE